MPPRGTCPGARVGAAPSLDDAERRRDQGLLRDPFIVGATKDCVAALARYRDLGVTRAAQRLCWPGVAQVDVLRMIALVGERVIPALRGSPTS